MQRKQWLFAVVAAAAMAAVATWQVRRHRGDEKKPALAAKASQGGHAFQHQHGGDHGRETPVDEPELRRGPSRVIFADEPKGKAKLAGRVVDGSGAPVAGATISVAAHPAQQATSKADGSFAFEGLLPLPYLVTAYAANGVAGPVEVRASEAAAAPLQLALRAGKSVELEAVDAEGKPLDGATIELRGALEVRIATTAQGRAVIGPVAAGSYHLAAWAEGYAPSFQPLVVSGDATSLRIELSKGSPVSGHVVDEAGQPVAEARVRFEAATDAIAGTDLLRDSTLTDKDGKFSFPAMAVGSYRFIATHATLGTQASTVTRVEGRGEVSAISIAMPAGAAVRGKVVDGSGAPAPFARVRLGITIPGSRLVVPPRELVTDDKGEFAVSGLARRQLTAVAMHERGSSPAVIVDARQGDVANVLLTLEARETLSGTVVDGGGKPVAGARVSVWPAVLERASGDGHGHGAGAGSGAGSAASGAGDLSLRKWQLVGFPSALTDERGEFRVIGLAAGGYRLRASRPEALSDERGLPGDFLDAKAGDAAVRVALPAEGSVKGRVAFADGTSPDRGTVAIGFAQRGFRGGELSIEALPPQTYQLVVRGPTFEPKVLEVKVEAGKVVDLGTVVVKPQS